MITNAKQGLENLNFNSSPNQPQKSSIKKSNSIGAKVKIINLINSGLNRIKNLWEFKTDCQLKSSPSISPDGKTLFVAGFASIYAIDITEGKKELEIKEICDKKWTTVGNFDSAISPYITPDGKFLIVKSIGGYLYKIHIASESLQSKKETGICAPPVITPDGKIFFIHKSNSCDERNICATDINLNEMNWIYEPGGIRDFTSLSLSPGGKTLFTATMSGKIFALDIDKNNKVIWGLNTEGEFKLPICPSNDGATLFVPGYCEIYAVNTKTGKKKWKRKLPGWSDSGACISPDNRILFINCNAGIRGANNGVVCAINSKDGKILWRLKINENLYSSPCISADGRTLFIGSTDGEKYWKIYAINAETGAIIDEYKKCLSSVPIFCKDMIQPYITLGPAGTIFAAVNVGGAYAFKFFSREEILSEAIESQKAKNSQSDNKITIGKNAVRIGAVTLPVNELYRKL